MRFLIRHVTRFEYDKPAYQSHNEVRLKPRPSRSQRTLGFRLETVPNGAMLEYRDAFDNTVHAISVDIPHRRLLVLADSLVERSAPENRSSLDDREERDYTMAEFLAGDAMRAQEQYDFLQESCLVPFSRQLKNLFWMVKPAMNEPVADYARRIAAWVRDQFAYEPGTTNVNSDLNHILSMGGGVCQDFAHLTIGLLRLAGIPARYVSGYLAPKVARGQGRALGEQASHAWCEVLLPASGWTGLDPTHGCPTTDSHIRVAVGRDYADVPPLRGVYRSAGGKQTMTVALQIEEADDFDPPPFDPGAIQQ